MWPDGHVYTSNGLLAAAWDNWLGALLPFIQSVVGTFVAPVILGWLSVWLLDGLVRRIAKWV